MFLILYWVKYMFKCCWDVVVLPDMRLQQEWPLILIAEKRLERSTSIPILRLNRPISEKPSSPYDARTWNYKWDSCANELVLTALKTIKISDLHLLNGIFWWMGHQNLQNWCPIPWVLTICSHLSHRSLENLCIGQAYHHASKLRMKMIALRAQRHRKITKIKFKTVSRPRADQDHIWDWRQFSSSRHQN